MHDGCLIYKTDVKGSSEWCGLCLFLFPQPSVNSPGRLSGPIANVPWDLQPLLSHSTTHCEACPAWAQSGRGEEQWLERNVLHGTGFTSLSSTASCSEDFNEAKNSFTSSEQ